MFDEIVIPVVMNSGNTCHVDSESPLWPREQVQYLEQLVCAEAEELSYTFECFCHRHLILTLVFLLNLTRLVLKPSKKHL